MAIADPPKERLRRYSSIQGSNYPEEKLGIAPVVYEILLKLHNFL
jgi:hypothetical protein